MAHPRHLIDVATGHVSNKGRFHHEAEPVFVAQVSSCGFIVFAGLREAVSSTDFESEGWCFSAIFGGISWYGEFWLMISLLYVCFLVADIRFGGAKLFRDFDSLHCAVVWSLGFHLRFRFKLKGFGIEMVCVFA